jgi:FkbH-like protein
MGSPQVEARPVLEAALASLRDPAKGASFAAYTAAANALARVSAEDSGLPPLRVAVLRNFTVEPLLPVLRVEIARAGFYPQLYVSDFDTIMPEALDPDSDFHAFEPDLVLAFQWLETLSPGLTTGFVSLGEAEAAEEVDRIAASCAAVVTAIRRRTSVPVLLNNFPLPLHPALGILDAQNLGMQTHSVIRLNQELLRRVRQLADAYVVDYMQAFARVGAEEAIDERYWQIGRAPLGRRVLIPLAREYGKFVRALRGKARKCLVLDCDGTLWGGIVGEDGVSGIKLGSGSPGAGFVAFQQEVLSLSQRGVILAICSKNNAADVREVFERHPDMLLREEHISAWQVNWNDKASNIRQIARDLNIGLDSLVFVDDSAFECGLIQDQLPDVAVLSMDGDPSTFRSRLAANGFFDSLTLSAEDRERGRHYAAEHQRQRMEEASVNLEDYLKKLELVAGIEMAREETIPRVSQLTQKTNQFNLTTRRYGEGAIRTFAEDPNTDVMTLTLADKVSSLGLVGVAIIRYASNRAEIDTFLMSCRALGRGAEDALLAAVLNRAAWRGFSRITGRYEPTERNAMVEKFYGRHGFEPTGSDNQGLEWSRSLGDAPVQGPRWVRVESTS